MGYPFKLTVLEPDLINFFKKLEKHRFIPIDDSEITSKLKFKLKPIRDDIFVGNDRPKHRNGLGLLPFVEVKTIERYSKNRNCLDVIFKKLF